MIKLVVKNQATLLDQQLDLYGNENINLTLQVDDVRDISNKNASYSKDFNLPATKTNNKFFEHYYNLDRYNNNFSAYKNIKAFLYVDDILVLEGFIKLLSVLDKETEISYNIVMFNDVANIIETLGDAQIKDLDLSELDHIVSGANILNSWGSTGVSLTAGGTSTVPFYALCNNNSLYVNNGEIIYNPYTHYILHIQLKYIIDKIFTFAGFTYNSNFFDSTYFSKIYFDTSINSALGNEYLVDPINLDDIAASDVNISTSITIPTSLTYITETDEDDLYNNTTGVYTAAFDCAVYIDALNIFENLNVSPQEVALVVKKVDAAGIPTYITLATHLLGNSQTATVQLNGTVFLQQNETIQIGFYANDFQTAVKIPAAYAAISSLDIYTYGFNLTDEAILARRGEIRLADVISDLTKIFNLNIEDNSNRNLAIEPYVDYITNTVIDWTNKADFNETVIEPLNIPKNIKFRHAEDEQDYYKNRYKQLNGIDFGGLNLNFDVDSDEEITIQTEVFSAPYTKRFFNTYIQHITEYDDSYKSYDNKPRLVFKKGTNFTDGIYQTGYTDFSELNTKYANATMYDENLEDCTTDTETLLFGTVYQQEFLNGGFTQPINTLFNKYWLSYINENYTEENVQILKINIKLTPTDINNFKFSYKVRIKNQLYRVNKIEYNTDVTKLAKVELLRI